MTFRIATIDPASIVAAIAAGEAFELPAFDGTLSATAGERLQETISYADVREDGTPVEMTRPPNVWWMEQSDGAARGVILAFNHTLRAWVRDEQGTTMIEPMVEGPSIAGTIREYRVYETPDVLDGLEPLPASADGDVGVDNHIAVFKDVYAYVDTQYRDQYGSCCWADQIEYILSLLNAYFNDVELEYRYLGGAVDAGFAGTSLDDAWDRLITKSFNGAEVRSHWSYRDFDGCDLGTASFPGSSFVIQHDPDDCHLGLLPGSDAERAYFTSRELGLNNNAHQNYAWSETTLFGHEHRSVMKDSLWGHLHGCWSDTNMDRMSSYLGTSSVGTAC